MTLAPYRHEALFYEGLDGFQHGVVPFLRDGIAAGDPTLVVVSAEKIGLLRDALGPDADTIEFASMSDVGDNPARIIPAWRDFVAEYEGRSIRGVGEPIDPDRDAAELVECQRHEALLNLAFADVPGFWLLCPYDAIELGDDVLHTAACNHPYLGLTHSAGPSRSYVGDAVIAEPFSDPLPRPATAFEAFAFDIDNLVALRTFVL